MSVVNIVREANLHFYEGSSDKVYHASIHESGDGYVVFFSYGRRGGHMTEGYKTNFSVTIDEAEKIFDKLVSSKIKKGYSYR